MRRGQALVEFAIVLPILLTLLVGAFFVGSAMVIRSQLQHAANEASTLAAIDGNCGEAHNHARLVLGHEPDRFTCSQAGPVIEVIMGDTMPIAIPFIDANQWNINVAARAMIREEEAP